MPSTEEGDVDPSVGTGMETSQVPPAAESAAPREIEMSLDEAVAYAKDVHRKGLVEDAAKIYAQVLGVQGDHVDALHFLGVAAMQLGSPQNAELLIRKTISLDPNNGDAHNNLGNVLKGQGKLDEARAVYARALELRPDNPDTLTNLASIRAAGKDYDGAIELYRKVIAAAPDHAEAYQNMANALSNQGRNVEALEALRTMLTLRPHTAEAYKRLGAALCNVGKVEDAIGVYETWVQLAPNDEEARHMLAAVTGQHVPSRASDAFVKQLFDGFSKSFDAVLQRLEYKAPAIVAETLANLLGEPAGTLEVLDAGCGTGLGGPFLRPYARRLVGVDLSPGMIDQARQRGVYDEFVVTELASYMNQHARTFDLVTAIDTFCYIGDLDETVRALSVALRPGGHAVFTVERSDAASAPDGFRLELHGRYSHSKEYLERILTGSGLRLELCRDQVLRKEAGKPVNGLAVVALRPLE